MDFDSIEELCNYLKNEELPRILLTDVYDKVAEIEQESIDTEVYDVYNPRKYIRRKTEGGLQDKDNIQPDVDLGGDDLTLEIINMTTVSPDSDDYSQGTYLDELIEYGKHEMATPYDMPRPYTQVTQDKIDNNPKLIESIIEKRLNNL